MQTRVRLALLAVVLAGAVVALRVQVVADPQPALERTPPAEIGGTAKLLVLLGVPMLAVVLFTALRYRRSQREPLDPRLWRPPGWHGALLALIAVLAVAALLGAVAQVTAPELRPEVSGGTNPNNADDGTAPTPTAEDVEVSTPGADVWAIVLAVTLLLLLAVLLLARWTVVPGSPAPAGQSTEPGEPQIAEAARHGLSVVDTPAGDARAAIIACYRAMEQSLAESPHEAPLPSDTPSDVLRRAMETGRLHGPGGAQLVALFAEARYSSHPMTDDDRRLAVSALRSILHESREPV